MTAARPPDPLRTYGAAIRSLINGRHHGSWTRFAPPEWRWNVLDAASDSMRPWYHRLTEEFFAAARNDAEQDVALDALEAAHDGAMAGICKAMTATARRGGIHGSLATNFVVVILERQRGDGEADLIRASVDPQMTARFSGYATAIASISRSHSSA